MAVRTSGSFRRYIVRGVKARPDDDAFFDALKKHRFRSIEDQPTEAPSIGWVSHGTFGATDFRTETVFLGKAVLLRLRIDRKKVPSNAIRVRLAELLSGQGKVTKKTRDAARKQVEKEILTRTVPATSVVDVLWAPAQERLLLASTSNAVHDAFTRAFKETFGAMPELATATPLAERVTAKQVDARVLRRLAPISTDATGAAGGERASDANGAGARARAAAAKAAGDSNDAEDEE